nr:chaperone protein dnaJ 1, mitochondrial isoform X2 [Ipomoea trifida]GMD85048.1 chaperone protein DnaJ 1, mitochondrial isoform X2 [Ipomoea batatas]GMD88843.1 chaperone protein DnaJ 1, mitochondrial isoform X2 [Ipomoea batatas]GMD91275.1 chaperone protein DnaJ 1, mitochondrial isoform X2 [Ipomoea batatas]GME08020.1 chaperone protein DnaJ 1, mitochondrial isoform X2 [Ipomoea batatas]
MDVKVTIPPGVDSGDTIRVQRAGHAGRRGMQPGNLFIKLKVDEDSVFDRDGADIYVDANISFTQAILGGKVEVPTLSGTTSVKAWLSYSVHANLIAALHCLCFCLIYYSFVIALML